MAWHTAQLKRYFYAHIHTRVILHLSCRSWAKVDRYGFVNSSLDIRSRAAGTRLYMGHAYMSVVEIARESKSIKQSTAKRGELSLCHHVERESRCRGAVRGRTVSFEAKARDFDTEHWCLFATSACWKRVLSDFPWSLVRAPQLPACRRLIWAATLGAIISSS